MLRLALITIFCVSFVLSMSTTRAPHHGTHRPRPSQEPAEHETFKFVYEPHSHMMVVVTGHNCYIFALSDAERSAIHTDAGISSVELKLLSSLTTASVTEVTKDQINVRTAHACGRVQHYYTETSA